MTLHPVLSLSFSLFLAVILLTAASHKLRAPHRFARQLEDYDLLPAAAIGSAARLLPLVEILIAFMLLVPMLRFAAALCAAGLLALYTGAIAINLWRDRRDIDCGCSGPGLERPLTGALIVRNIVLLVMAVLSALPTAGVMLHGFGMFVIGASVATGLILYTAIEGLLANRPRLDSLSRSQS